MKTLFIIFILGTLSVIHSAPIRDFSASFRMTSTDMESPYGVKSYVTGQFTYSWSSSAMKITFNLDGRVTQTEHYTYINNGLDSKNYPNQQMYKQFVGGNGCCEVSILEQDQPSLFITNNLFTQIVDKTPVKDEFGNICKHYAPKSASTLLDVWVNDNGEICKANMIYLKHMSTMRSFEFYNVAQIAPTPSMFAYTIPEDCTCTKPVDVVLVMDRSGSISQAEYLQQQQFLSDFASQFEFGSNKVILSIVEFNTNAFPKALLPLSSGISSGNVRTAVNQFSCCIKPNFDRNKPSKGDSSCCTGYTSISSGLYAAGEQLATDSNVNTTKIIVMVTDGFHNTLRSNASFQCYSNKDGKTCDGLQDGTLDMYKCVTSAHFAPYRKMCLDDLQSTVNSIRRMIPGVIFYSVFVGSFVPPEEISIITNNDTEKQIQVNDFSRLKDFTKTLTQKICTIVGKPCGECCGFCACGVCYPGVCEKKPCVETTQTVGTACCRDTPRICPPSSDRCENTFCDVTTNSCSSYHNSTSNPCLRPPYVNNPCFIYSCDPTNGQCKSTAKTCDGMPGYDPKNKCQKCICEKPDENDPTTWSLNYSITECSGPDLCSDYFCDASDGQCKFLPKPQPDDDPCKYYCCEPSTGNWTVQDIPTCDKSNLNRCEMTCSCQTNDPCFEYDKCDTVTGQCLFKPKSCDDGNACTEDFCDNGECVHKDMNKCLNGTNMCLFTSCDPISGNCMFSPKDCDDNNCCTQDICLPETGDCIHIPIPIEDVCPGGNACITMVCNPSAQTDSECCVPIPTVCDDNKNCTVDKCDTNRGCLFELIDCYDILTTNDSAPDCNTAVCNEEKGGLCEWQGGICPVLIAVPVTIGVIVGVVLAVLAFFALAGGGSYAAITSFASPGAASVVQTNPLYEPNSLSHDNALWEGN